MKIEETCPNCGAQHTVTTESTEAFRISCGCGEKYLSFDARRPSSKKTRWMNRARPGNSTRSRMRGSRPLVKGHTSEGGKVVPKEIAEKLRKAYGGTVTGRTVGHYKPNDPIQIADSADGELRFIDSKTLTWPKKLSWDLSVGEHAQEQSPPKDKPFNGHGAPDTRTDLIKRFQDVFGRDQ